MSFIKLINLPFIKNRKWPEPFFTPSHGNMYFNSNIYASMNQPLILRGLHMDPPAHTTCKIRHVTLPGTYLG